MGIISGHSYTILSAHEIYTEQGRQVKLLKLRNPYGQVEWEGDWSDESDKWTPELRAELNVVIANDGIFYIAFHDYLKHFRCTSINYETRKSR